MKTTMRNLFVKFWLAMTILAYSPLARGQTALQPQYIRPAVGPAITVFDDEALSNVTGEVSSVLDWRGFRAVQIVVQISSTTCSYNPRIRVRTNLTSTVLGTLILDDPNSDMTFDSDTDGQNIVYEVAGTSPYISIALDAISAGGATSCTVDVSVVPIPVPDGEARSIFGQRNVSFGTTSVSTTATVVGVLQFNSPRRKSTITVQNQSTSVVFCGFRDTVTDSSYAVTLKASSAAKDGTGGSWTVEGYSGPLYCIVSSGTAGVSYYTY